MDNRIIILMKITSKTSVVGIIGHPVEHSLSPVIHNACFRALKLPFVYVAFDVTDVENAIRGIKALGIRGVSVTIPHKISVIKYLDKVEGIAQKIGAVNTIINDGDKLIGYNTDAYGISAAFREAGVNLSGKRCLVLGSGGAARAAAFVLCEAGPELLSIASIENDQLTVLVNDLSKHYRHNIKGINWTDESIKQLFESSEIIINATPVGMWPKIDETPVSQDLIQKRHIVFDVIYTPPETRFLKAAKKHGCITISGVEMFLHQAAEQFRLFTGREVSLQIIRKALRENLKK